MQTHVCVSRVTATAVAILLAGVTSASAATWYVSALDPSCTPATPGAGTFNDPWQNLYYATTHLSCGDTLYLRGGTYRLSVNGYTSACDSGGGNGQHSLGYFTQVCTSSRKITVRPYNKETVILDGTSTRIDDPSTGPHWKRCEGPTQCGGCSGLALTNYARTFYSEPWNFGSADTEQMWIDPDPSNPLSTGTRLKWVGTRYGKCENLNGLTGGCFDMNACGTFDTAALDRAIVARLPDRVANPDPNAHVVKISSAGGTAASPLFVFNGAKFIDVVASSTLYFKYGYYGMHFDGGASNITIDGVRIVGIGGRDYGQCVRTADGNNITIKNSVCAETASEGIGFYGGGDTSCIQVSGNVALSNIIHDTGFASSSNDTGAVLDDGIIMKSCSGCSAIGNVLYNIGRNGVKVRSDVNGTVLCNADHALIDGNRISKACLSTSAAMTSDCAGVDAVRGEGSVTGTIIQNNMIFEVLGSKSVMMPRGIKVDAGVTNTTIVNNSLFNIAEECIDTNEDAGAPGNFVVRNNAMYTCGVKLNAAAAARLNAVGDWVHSNNTYWSDQGTKPAVHIDSIGKTYGRDAVVSMFEAPAVQVNPLFVSPTDLHLQPESPLRDAGTRTNAPATDIDGTPRPQGAAWDIGAHELLSPPVVISVEPMP